MGAFSTRCSPEARQHAPLRGVSPPSGLAGVVGSRSHDMAWFCSWLVVAPLCGYPHIWDLSQGGRSRPAPGLRDPGKSDLSKAQGGAQTPADFRIPRADPATAVNSQHEITLFSFISQAGKTALQPPHPAPKSVGSKLLQRQQAGLSAHPHKGILVPSSSGNYLGLCALGDDCLHISTSVRRVTSG